MFHCDFNSIDGGHYSRRKLLECTTLPAIFGGISLHWLSCLGWIWPWLKLLWWRQSGLTQGEETDPVSTIPMVSVKHYGNPNRGCTLFILLMHFSWNNFRSKMTTGNSRLTFFARVKNQLPLELMNINILISSFAWCVQKLHCMSSPDWNDYWPAKWQCILYHRLKCLWKLKWQYHKFPG